MVKATLVEELSLMRKEVNDKDAELLSAKSEGTFAITKVKTNTHTRFPSITCCFGASCMLPVWFE
jgi:hypothetical protein